MWLRSYAWEGLGPAQVIDRCDDVVQGLGMAAMATAVYARMERGAEGWQLTYSNAGHPPPAAAPDRRLRGAAHREPLAAHRGHPGHHPRRDDGGLPRRRPCWSCTTDGLIDGAGHGPGRAHAAHRRHTLAGQASDLPVEELCDHLLEVLGVDSLRDDAVVLAIRLDDDGRA